MSADAGWGPFCHLFLTPRSASPEVSELVTLPRRVSILFPFPPEVTLEAPALPSSDRRLDSPGTPSVKSRPWAVFSGHQCLVIPGRTGGESLLPSPLPGSGQAGRGWSQRGKAPLPAACTHAGPPRGCLAQDRGVRFDTLRPPLPPAEDVLLDLHGPLGTCRCLCPPKPGLSWVRWSHFRPPLPVGPG